jgi:hypothetical protein
MALAVIELVDGNRSGTFRLLALMTASAVIELSDINTLKVVATLPSQCEVELQPGIPRTNISRGLRQGRPLGGYFWRPVRLHSLKSNARKDATGENTAKGHTLVEEIDVVAMVNGLSQQLIHEKRLFFLQEAKIDRIENQM